jgi:hypothetical protein
MTTTNLTDKEQALLAAIEYGMDEPGCGWLGHLVCDVVRAGHDWANNHHAVAAVLGSLIAKGLVESDAQEEDGMATAYWISLV